MNQTIEKAIDIIHEIISVIKSTGKGIQISGDANTAKRIKRAIEDGDIKKLRKIIARGGIYIDETDIMGYTEIDGIPFVIVTAEFIVNYRQLFKTVRRYRRKEG